MSTTDEDRQRRLLDLLAGWQENLESYLHGFTQEDHVGVTKEEYEAEQEAVGKLYQWVGSHELFTHEHYQEAMVRIGNIIRTGGT